MSRFLEIGEATASLCVSRKLLDFRDKLPFEWCERDVVLHG